MASADFWSGGFSLTGLAVSNSFGYFPAKLLETSGQCRTREPTMFVYHEQARERFERLTKPTSEGVAFFPFGARGAGYRLDERAAQRIKLYFAYQFWIVMGLFAIELALLSKLLDTHPFFAALVAGAIFWAIDLLVMHGLSLRSPRVSTRLRTDDFVGPTPNTSSRLETSCTLVNIAMVLLLCIVFALLTRSIDAWLYAIACAAFFAYSLFEARKARRATSE